MTEDTPAYGPEEEEPDPFACQQCGKVMRHPLTTGFAKKVNGVQYVATLCPDCMVAFHGMEWRPIRQSSIVVPGRAVVQ